MPNKRTSPAYVYGSASKMYPWLRQSGWRRRARSTFSSSLFERRPFAWMHISARSAKRSAILFLFSSTKAGSSSSLTSSSSVGSSSFSDSLASSARCAARASRSANRDSRRTTRRSARSFRVSSRRRSKNSSALGAETIGREYSSATRLATVVFPLQGGPLRAKRMGRRSRLALNSSTTALTFWTRPSRLFHSSTRDITDPSLVSNAKLA
mmetsp:Transcript_6551/g.11566  ORF Transcript_6551/g.11566 Transcript_6551/m.11566 type:complete len:210 (-) Transcript_6551:125-754(-)